MLQALASTTTSVLSTVTSSSSLSSEQIQTLYLLYTSSFLSALDILDREEVVKTEVGEGDLTRLVWTVLGSSDRPYVVLPEADYCSCPAFHANVIVTRQTAMCKHLLAVKLSLVLNRGVTHRRMDIKDYLHLQTEGRV